MIAAQTSPPAIDEACYRGYLEALLIGNWQHCAKVLEEQLLRRLPLKSMYLDLIQRAMYEVGTLWEQNLVSVATEHLASATTERLLGFLYPRLFSQTYKDRRAIIACIAQEYHQIGPRMVADFFELHGWHGFFLGANTPAPHLIRMIRERNPDVLCLSMSLLFNLPQLESTLQIVSGEFPALQLFLGGRALNGEGAGRQVREELMRGYPRLRYFESLSQLESYLISE